jgi:hypothetical protein
MRDVVPFVAWSASPRYASGFAVHFIHFKPESNLMTGWHVLLEKWDEGSGDKGIELEEPGSR